MIDYFKIDAVSNSALGAVKNELYNIEEVPNLKYHFAFGTLVDAMLTEPDDVIEEARYAYAFTDDQIKMAEKMYQYCMKDPLIVAMLKQAIGQYIYLKTMDFSQNGFAFKMKCKCKFDLFSKPMKMGLDFKTLSVSSYNQFLTSIDRFDYDRQAAFYMDLSGIDRFWIIGISKVNANIFKIAIERGDDVYKSGREKVDHWAHKYYTLKYNQNQSA